MQAASLLESVVGDPDPAQVQAMLAALLPADSSAQRAAAIEQALRSPAGPALRAAVNQWIVERLVPASALVPDAYARWRPVVREAMLYVMAQLSPSRLAPKLLEQLELPKRTPPEKRLMRLIAEVPGLQKLGQVLARNRHLRPRLRRALIGLENGIHDVQPEQVRAIVERELGERLLAHEVRLAGSLLSEASVSAILRFTWRNPATGKRERGVFKVLKPHIAQCFAEDMRILHGLAQHFSAHLDQYGFAGHALPDTFAKIRRLLQHEVNFPREQATLREVQHLYCGIPRTRVPVVIEPLCTPRITAITEEQGVKVTSAVSRMPRWQRVELAEHLVEVLVAAPLFAGKEEAIFHADPHAGNLLYDPLTRNVVVLDWALTERLTREQRRHLAMLFFLLALRDRAGVCREVESLRERGRRSPPRQNALIRETVMRYLDELPWKGFPSGAEAMRLLEILALKGIAFPPSLIMLSKVIFTLEGILRDIGGTGAWMTFTLGRHLAQRWLAGSGAVRSPLRKTDWLTVQASALLYGGRAWIRAEEMVLERLLHAGPAVAS